MVHLQVDFSKLSRVTGSGPELQVTNFFSCFEHCYRNNDFAKKST